MARRLMRTAGMVEQRGSFFPVMAGRFFGGGLVDVGLCGQRSAISFAQVAKQVAKRRRTSCTICSCRHQLSGAEPLLSKVRLWAPLSSTSCERRRSLGAQSLLR